MADSSKIRIGYLVSRYPAVSHTFILREVLTLRRHGIEIEVASINHPDRDRSALTLEEQSEAARSFYVKDAGAAGAGISLAWLLFRHPFRYFQGLWSAVRLGGTDVSRIIRCFFYFVEAAMLTRWMRKMGLRHLHVHFATPAATVALILARMAPVGFSLTVHGPDEFYDVPGYYLAEKIASAQFVCAIGLYARSQLMKLSPFEHWEKFEVSPLGVDPEQFAPRPFRIPRNRSKSSVSGVLSRPKDSIFSCSPPPSSRLRGATCSSGSWGMVRTGSHWRDRRAPSVLRVWSVLKGL